MPRQEIKIRIAPQPGPQTQFLSTKADICIYGGGAGSGKTYGLALEGLRYRNVPNFSTLILRRTLPEIKKEGGLWDETTNLYALFNATSSVGNLRHVFPGGGRVAFGGMEHEWDKKNYHGAQIPCICFDEVQTFTETQFTYMFSRNRSSTGIKGYIRGTCNPEADSWLKKWLKWWLDEKTGFPIAERSGVLRWFVRINNVNHWADKPEELTKKYGDKYLPRSFTFIAATVFDNKILLQKDPGYLASLQSLDTVERGRLLEGNWNIKPTAGIYFPRSKVNIIPLSKMPRIVRECRYWDRAGTIPTPENPDPDWTAGARMCVGEDNRIYIRHINKFQLNADEVQANIYNTASQDGHQCEIGLEQEPGASGKFEAQYVARKVSGYTVKIFTATKNKVTRASPLASQWQAGNVTLIEGAWNEEYLSEMENFPTETGHDDQVDASSGAFNMLFDGHAVTPVNLNDSDLDQPNGWDLNNVQ